MIGLVKNYDKEVLKGHLVKHKLNLCLFFQMALYN